MHWFTEMEISRVVLPSSITGFKLSHGCKPLPIFQLCFSLQPQIDSVFGECVSGVLRAHVLSLGSLTGVG